MAKETGTATGHQDLLSKLQTFANLHGWTTLLYNTVGNHELILKGEGDGTDEIFVRIRVYTQSSLDNSGWACRGARDYKAGRLTGGSTSVYVPLKRSNMNYWFWITGRRICMIAKTGSAYQFMYLGFINQYAAKEEYPYPLLVMGSSYTPDMEYNTTDSEYSSTILPTANNTNAVGYLWFIDGAWIPIANPTSHIETENRQASVWPFSKYLFNENNTMTGLFSAKGPVYGRGGNPLGLWRAVPSNISAKVAPVLPLILINTTKTHQLYGELHNIYWCPLTDNIEAEDIITDSVSSTNYIVFQNIHRTDPWCGLAIKDE